MAGLIGCMECKTAKEQFTQLQCLRNVFAVHVSGIHPVHSSGKLSKDKKRHKDPRSIKENRQVMRNHLHKVVCALQNSGGGAILVHLAEQHPDDRYLGYFDEFINPIFQNAFEDGCMAFECYERRWLCDSGDFSEFNQFVCLSVCPLSYVSTVEFNTKIRNDVESTEPSLRCLLRCLKIKCERTQPHVRGLHGELFENRNIELKSWKSCAYDLQNTKEMAEFIWYKLRMRENITSMSKLPEGGSMYIGIDERVVEKASYKTVELLYSGIPKTVSYEGLRMEFQRLAFSHLVVLNSSRVFEDAPQDLFRLNYHDVGPDIYVLEISVGYVPGIVFYDKNGPRSHKVCKGVVSRMTREEWVETLPNWEDQSMPMFPFLSFCKF